jgi:hypothetical protein
MRTVNTMSDTAKPVPGSVQRDQNGKAAACTLIPEPVVDDQTKRQEIMRLAFGLWQERGCPIDSPEEDWIKAERLFRGA